MQSFSSVIALLLFLFLVHSCTSDSNSETIVIFKGDKTEVPYKWDDGTITMKKRRAFSFPAFVGGVVDEKEFFAVFCDALYEVSGGASFMESATKISYADYKQWSDAEIFANMTIKKGEKTVLRNVTAVMNGNKIYALAVSGDKSLHFLPQRGSGTTPLDTVIFVGTVVNSEKSGGNGKTVTWEKQESLKNLFPSNTDKQSVSHFSGGLGNGVIMKNGTIVLPVKMTNSRNNNNYQPITNSIIYSSDNGVTWHLGSETQFSTPKGHVVEFGEGKLILFAQRTWGSPEVFESDDMGATWKDSLIFSFVFHKVPDKMRRESYDGVVTVPVDGKDVLLFSVSLNTDVSQTINTLQLWVSDGQRIVRVGTISDEEKEVNTENSILAHVGDYLYIMHKINPDGVYGVSPKVKEWEQIIGFTPLPKVFASAKTTLRAWRKLDEWFVSKGVPTEGLVGFLKNTKKDKSVWEDMYMCVDATVNGGESVDGGFSFSGAPESHAEWPVSSQGQNQVYIFAHKQFTLAATVKIYTGNANGQFLVIGASLESDDNSVLIGLGYTHDNKWFVVSDGNPETTTEETIKCEKEYHFALTFGHGKATVYVDGLNVGGDKKISSSAPIHHFFMGGIKQSSTAKGNPCTVKNVMLFNQVLSQNKIAKLTQVNKQNKLEEEEEEETTTALPKSKIEDSTSVISTDPTESSVPSMQNVTTVKVNETKIHTYPPNLGDRVFKKDTKGDTVVVGSMFAVDWMFFVFFIVCTNGTLKCLAAIMYVSTMKSYFICFIMIFLLNTYTYCIKLQQNNSCL